MQADLILRELRLAAGLSRRELARRSATSPSTLAGYETGTVVPTVAVLDRIVRAAGYTMQVQLVPGELSEVARGHILADLLVLAEQFPWADPGPLAFPPLDGAITG